MNLPRPLDADTPAAAFGPQLTALLAMWGPGTTIGMLRTHELRPGDVRALADAPILKKQEVTPRPGIGRIVEVTDHYGHVEDLRWFDRHLIIRPGSLDFPCPSCNALPVEACTRGCEGRVRLFDLLPEALAEAGWSHQATPAAAPSTDPPPTAHKCTHAPDQASRLAYLAHDIAPGGTILMTPAHDLQPGDMLLMPCVHIAHIHATGLGVAVSSDNHDTYTFPIDRWLPILRPDDPGVPCPGCHRTWLEGCITDCDRRVLFDEDVADHLTGQFQGRYLPQIYSYIEELHPKGCANGCGTPVRHDAEPGTRCPYCQIEALTAANRLLTDALESNRQQTTSEGA